MSPDPLMILRQVNQNLRVAISRLRPEEKLCTAITPGDFSGLLAELLRAGECLRNFSPSTEDRVPENSPCAGALEREAHEYRTHLEQLKRFLPDLHGRLLTEKARLQNAQTHVAAASSWAKTSKKTL